MKIFLDTADIEQIRRAFRTGLIDGVTTNPSHIAKGGRPFKEVVKEICEIVPGHVSAEAMGETTAELIVQAEEISKIAPQVVVKIPMGYEGLKAVGVLEARGIRTNVTMAFSATQAHLAMKAGASYVSIVLSRLENVGQETDVLIHDTAEIKRTYGFNTEIIAGSVKTQPTILTCLRAGIDIMTIPDSLFLQLFKHPLTDAALVQFAKDWEKVPQ